MTWLEFRFVFEQIKILSRFRDNYLCSRATSKRRRAHFRNDNDGARSSWDRINDKIWHLRVINSKSPIIRWFFSFLISTAHAHASDKCPVTTQSVQVYCIPVRRVWPTTEWHICIFALRHKVTMITSSFTETFLHIYNNFHGFHRWKGFSFLDNCSYHQSLIAIDKEL